MSFFTSILKTVGSIMPVSLVNKLGREYFNHRFHAYGTMTNLQIDSANHRATCDLELKGETQPLHVEVGRYELASLEGKTFIIVHEITTSREWLTQLAQKFVKGKKFEVPEALTSVL